MLSDFFEQDGLCRMGNLCRVEKIFNILHILARKKKKKEAKDFK